MFFYILIVLLIILILSIYLNGTRQTLVATKLVEIFDLIEEINVKLLYPKEIVTMLKIKYRANSIAASSNQCDDLNFCYLMLKKVSRSFAFVIEQLPNEIKDVVCIFYLILRGLDTIEDDMSIPIENKIILLRNFHKNLSDDNFSLTNIGDKDDYKVLLRNFPKIIRSFKTFGVKYQNIILDITEKMAYGMSIYLSKNEPIESLTDYNEYCHFVAGLVGIGLSSIFAESHLEDKSLFLKEDLSNHMGLFLQKTNVIRDYFEDIQENRIWWPKDIWIKYTNDFYQFQNKSNDQNSLDCLNEMILDAITHLPYVIQYLRSIKNEKNFKFCAIPQLMALATIVRLYNNPFVFTSNVKISKVLTFKLIANSSNLSQMIRWFRYFIRKLEHKIPKTSNDNDKRLREIIKNLNGIL